MDTLNIHETITSNRFKLKTWLNWLLEYTFGGKLSHFLQDV